MKSCSRCGHGAWFHGSAKPVCDIAKCRCTGYVPNCAFRTLPYGMPCSREDGHEGAHFGMNPR
jgi:hypothetical protein